VMGSWRGGWFCNHLMLHRVYHGEVK
jgi:hypothetical protein